MDYNSYLNHPLKPQQHEYLDYARTHHYSLLAARMGNGKTLVGITLGLIGIGRIVIVCPAFLKINWKKEFEEFSKKANKIFVATGSNLKKLDPNKYDVIIVNYAILGRCEFIFDGATTVIFDESHYLLNPKAKRTKAAVSFINKYLPERLLLMTGTPNKGKAQQWYVPLFMCSLNPKNTSGIDMRNHVFTYWGFQHMFCNKTMLNIAGRTVTQFTGLKNVVKLRKLLKGKYMRGKKADHSGIKLEFTEVFVDYEKEDPELEKAWAEFQSGSAISEHIMSAKASSALAKCKFTVDYVGNIIDTEGSAIVYSDHIAPVEVIGRALNLKYNVRMITGATPMDRRQEYVEMFQSGEIECLVATITSFNTGVTLTKSSNIIMNDRNWDNTQNDQAHHRIFRIGQKKNCLIHDVLGSEVDKMISRNIRIKDKVIQATVEEQC